MAFYFYIDFDIFVMMEAYIVYPTKEQEKIITVFLNL